MIWTELWLVLFLIGLATAPLVCWFLLRILRAVGLVAANYRDVEIPRPSGLTLPIVASVAGVRVSAAPSDAASITGLIVFVGWGFALIGLLDDWLGDKNTRGFKGHLAALRRGRVTTGLVKAVGGLAIGLAAGAMLEGSWPRVVLAGALIALFANTLNLLDVRPGRAVKSFCAAAAVAWAFSPGRPAWTLWPALVPAVVVLLVVDLREWGMLGDSGSNFLGAVLGLTFVVNFGWQVQLAAAIVLAAATVASEKYSFSDAIEKVSALRWLDMLGRRST